MRSAVPQCDYTRDCRRHNDFRACVFDKIEYAYVLHLKPPLGVIKA